MTSSAASYLCCNVEFSLKGECLQVWSQLHFVVDGHHVCRQTLERLLLLRHDWSHSRVWSPLLAHWLTTYTRGWDTDVECRKIYGTATHKPRPLRVEYFDLCVCSRRYWLDRTRSKARRWPEDYANLLDLEQCCHVQYSKPRSVWSYQNVVHNNIIVLWALIHVTYCVGWRMCACIICDSSHFLSWFLP